MSIDVKNMTDEELNVALSAISQEISSRKVMADVPKKMDVLNRDYLAAAGLSDGATWVQPTGAHDAYPQFWLVEHGGKTWMSLIPANVWEPGVSGWREQVDPPSNPEDLPEDAEDTPTFASWVQPTGGHDAYKKGDIVSHDGRVWTSTADANVWAPGVYGWVAA